MLHTRIFALVILSLVGTLQAAQEKFRFERPLMGTRFTIVCYAEEKSLAEKAADAAWKIAETLDATASDYLPDSELSALSTKPAGVPVPLSPLLYELLDQSRRIAEATGGAFDPTLAPVTRLWRESRDRRRLPDPAALRSALARTGWRRFTLDPGSHTLTLHREGMAFDLGGMAKGHAADLMLGAVAAHGITRAMVVAGGDVRLGDPPPGRDGWRIALQTFDLSRPEETVTLSNAAVSTSGDLHQSVEIDGVRYSHILSPATGLGLTRRIAATVIADEGKLADPLATAACVMGAESVETLRRIPGVRDVKVRTP